MILKFRCKCLKTKVRIAALQRFYRCYSCSRHQKLSVNGVCSLLELHHIVALDFWIGSKVCLFYNCRTVPKPCLCLCPLSAFLSCACQSPFRGPSHSFIELAVSPGDGVSSLIATRCVVLNWNELNDGWPIVIRWGMMVTVEEEGLTASSCL